MLMMYGTVHWIDCHGLYVRNQAGENFLRFCEINQLSIMNNYICGFRRHIIMVAGCILVEDVMA